ncbi:S1 RNA-binding domain-containing protein [Amphritea balenae]|uniref:S1 RNA-binding domain-containing protein n=1 Tax=Amphritea balenae TaxID=452629 RepID=UPI001E4BC3D8|nr:S1 RNA-binding domain-containing protein [Amphritea balenae]
MKLAEGIEGYMKVGEEVEAKIVNLDRRNRSISLSIKAKDQADEKVAIEAVAEQTVETAGPNYR